MPEIKIIQNKEVWDQALQAIPTAHALQSWDWGDFKSRWGWRADRLLWLDDSAGAAARPVAAAQILTRRIPRTPWQFLYVSKGPMLDYADTALVTQVLTDLELYAKNSKALFIKIDPDVPQHYGQSSANGSLEAIGQSTLKLLKQHHWRYSPEQIQFRNTVVIDLTADSDDILARMKSKWRYNIRLAGRKGVAVKVGDKADLPIFYQMYKETARRDGFLIRPEAYYFDVWRRFLDGERANLLLASVNGEAVAGLIIFIFGQRAWYMYGASSGQHRNLMPNHLLQWTAISRAKDRGCTHYDMWGAPDIFDESDPMWGVYRFKQGFGGQAVHGLGAFDYPVQPALYWAFTVVLPKFRLLLRQVRGE